jgi:hypothetical protein
MHAVDTIPSLYRYRVGSKSKLHSYDSFHHTQAVRQSSLFSLCARALGYPLACNSSIRNDFPFSCGRHHSRHHNSLYRYSVWTKSNLKPHSYDVFHRTLAVRQSSLSALCVLVLLGIPWHVIRPFATISLFHAVDTIPVIITAFTGTAFGPNPT